VSQPQINVRNHEYRQSKLQALGVTRDSSPAPSISRSVIPPPVNGKRLTVAEINAANRAYTAAKRGQPK
jgi:hypothetical protein